MQSFRCKKYQKEQASSFWREILLKGELLHKYFLRILLRLYEHRFPQTLSVSKIAYLTYQTFCLGFCLSTTEKTHSRDILLPDILLAVVQFFHFVIVNPPNLNSFSTSIFSEIYYAFCFENLRQFHF